MGHIGVELEVGLNVHKPFYKLDWQINKGYTYVEQVEGEPVTITILGDLDWYYKMKRLISTRFGLKYYLFNTDRAPKNNLFLAAHINANLGQADFIECSLGYVFRFRNK